MSVELAKFFIDQGVLFLFFLLAMWGANRFFCFIAPVIKLYFAQQNALQTSIQQTLNELVELQRAMNARLDFIEHYLHKELKNEE